MVLYDLVISHADNFLSLGNIHSVEWILSSSFVSVVAEVTLVFEVNAWTSSIGFAYVLVLLLLLNHHVKKDLITH